MKAEAELEEMRASLDDALMKSGQLEDELIAMRMKQQVKEEELEKEREMFKRSTIILARQKDELEVSVCVHCTLICTQLPHPQPHL